MMGARKALNTKIHGLFEIAKKATPFPWTYDDGRTDGDERGKPQLICCSNIGPLYGRIIADLYSDTKPQQCIPTPEESDANGRLIAGIGAMLEMIQEQQRDMCALKDRINVLEAAESCGSPAAVADQLAFKDRTNARLQSLIEGESKLRSDLAARILALKRDVPANETHLYVDYYWLNAGLVAAADLVSELNNPSVAKE